MVLCLLITYGLDDVRKIVRGSYLSISFGDFNLPLSFSILFQIKMTNLTTLFKSLRYNMHNL